MSGMGFFLIIAKIFTSIIGFIWNSIMWVINFFISIFNKSIRQRNDRISRGVTELKKSTIDEMTPSNANVDNMVISGGDKSVRAEWIAPILTNAYYKSLPVIVLHEGNEYLYNHIISKLSSNEVTFIDSKNPIYEPFYNYSSKEIAKLIIESATSDYEIKKNAVYYIEGMCEFLCYKNVVPSLNSFYKCPHLQLFDKVDNLIIQGVISDTQGQAIKSKLMMGQSEQIKLETLIGELYEQFEEILCRSKSTPSNIINSLINSKVLLIDISSNANNLLVNYLLNQVKHAIQKGKKCYLFLMTCHQPTMKLSKKHC